MHQFCIVFIISSFIIIPTTTSITLDCKFKIENSTDFGETYFCDVQNVELISTRFNRTIKTITGTHWPLKTHDDVKGVLIDHSKVLYFPLGMEKLFRNLIGVTIFRSKLREVRKDDLKSLKKLRNLNLSFNQLEVIEPNLFEHNKKLEGIYLNNNKISHIDAKVFNNLSMKLNFLTLNENFCEFNLTKINEIVAKVQTGSCRNEEKLSEHQLKPEMRDQLETFKRIVEEKIGEEMSKLEKMLLRKFEQKERILKSEFFETKEAENLEELTENLEGV